MLRLEDIKFATPEPEPTSFLSESTDESFELKEKPSEYDNLLIQPFDLSDRSQPFVVSFY
ncbi:hypothetical protein INT48_008447 [Thamnidium elegans]|uniref:Uncharacterized protein n=1 Tax=Thamnidium elegans TaxID=101142 RepID=A0A8H7SQY2_9FUNG|nr:hypothetical protein INT48_008447 [Thamnidium elegans]